MSLTTVSLSRSDLGLALNQLAAIDRPIADRLYNKLIHSYDAWWPHAKYRRAFCTARLTADELDAFVSIGLPGIINLWSATYRLDPNSAEGEITSETITRPTKRRKFGSRIHYLHEYHPINEEHHPKEGTTMARKTKPADDELDELDGLDDLDDDETDEDEEDEAPAKPARRGRPAAAKSKAAAKPATKKKGNRTPPSTRPLPEGKLGASDVAELVGGTCTGRDVRMYLRKNEVETTDGRYVFSKAQADKIAKAIKASRK